MVWKEIIKPAAILVIVCAVVALALGVSSLLTAPVIEQRALETQANTVKTVVPDATVFDKIDVGENLARNLGVVSAYKCSDAGYAITLAVKGYGGIIEVMVGVRPDGKIIKAEVLEHAETPGLGSVATEPEYLDKFIGLADSAGIDAISGATISSSAVKKALNNAIQTVAKLEGSV